MTALETRRGGGLTSDPDANVMIDDLMSRGLVRSIEVWTDAEAETCRLVAFDLAQREAPEHQDGVLRPYGRKSVVRNWYRAYRGIFAIERFYSAFDLTPDYALESVDVALVERAWVNRVGTFEDAR